MQQALCCGFHSQVYLIWRSVAVIKQRARRSMAGPGGHLSPVHTLEATASIDINASVESNVTCGPVTN